MLRRILEVALVTPRNFGEIEREDFNSMTRLVLTWVGKPFAFELRPGLNTLGRNPTNDFRLSDASVSSFHAEIAVSDAEIKVRDLNSTNGTYINGAQVQEAVLKQNDLLKLGFVELALEEVIVTAPAPRNIPVAPPEDRCACSTHPETEAAYRCEVCSGAFCDACVKVVGYDRAAASTVCPVCHGQCYPIKTRQDHRDKEPGIMGRLTQTMKVAFHRGS
jgi:hypothetical protein